MGLKRKAKKSSIRSPGSKAQLRNIKRTGRAVPVKTSGKPDAKLLPPLTKKQLGEREFAHLSRVGPSGRSALSRQQDQVDEGRGDSLRRNALAKAKRKQAETKVKRIKKRLK